MQLWRHRSFPTSWQDKEEMLDYTKKNAKKRVEFLNVLHIVLGAVLLVQAVIGFISPQKNIRMFPFIFLTGAAMSVEDLIYKLKHLPRGKKSWGGVIFNVFLMLLLIAVTVLSFKAFIL